MHGSRKDSQELSKSILQTAKALFEEHGVEAVSMHQIAKAAGIGQGTLYRRYANKGDLCMMLLKENFSELIEELKSDLQQSAHLPPCERLCCVFRKLFLFHEKRSKLLGEIHAHRKMEHKKTDFFQSPPYTFLHHTISDLLEEANRSRKSPIADPAVTAHFFISALSPHTYMHLRDTYEYTPERIADLFCESFVKPLCG